MVPCLSIIGLSCSKQTKLGNIHISNQWLSTEYTQFYPSGYFAMSRDILRCHNSGGGWELLLASTMHQRVPKQRLIQVQTSIVPRLKNPALNEKCSYIIIWNTNIFVPEFSLFFLLQSNRYSQPYAPCLRPSRYTAGKQQLTRLSNFYGKRIWKQSQSFLPKFERGKISPILEEHASGLAGREKERVDESQKQREPKPWVLATLLKIRKYRNG